jgi:hypothetical protein
VLIAGVITAAAQSIVTTAAHWSNVAIDCAHHAIGDLPLRVVSCTVEPFVTSKIAFSAAYVVEDSTAAWTSASMPLVILISVVALVKLSFS